MDNIGKYDFIFIAQYPKVLELLKTNNIAFVVVAPDNSKNLLNKERQLIKQQWFGRFLLRNNSHIKNLEKWIKKLDDNYESWTSYEHLTMHNPSELVLLKEDEYLSDKIKELYLKKEETQKVK